MKFEVRISGDVDGQTEADLDLVRKVVEDAVIALRADHKVQLSSAQVRGHAPDGEHIVDLTYHKWKLKKAIPAEAPRMPRRG